MNRIGARLDAQAVGDPFAQRFGAVLLEMAPGQTLGAVVGETTEDYALVYGDERVALDAVQEVYESKLDKVFPYRAEGERVPEVTYTAKTWPMPAVLSQKPAAFIPTFPGTNCEVDTARALARAGAEPKILVINNLTPEAITQSLLEAERLIAQSQMIVFPGGFSGGDEPDGSGKFITAFFRNPRMRDAVNDLLKHRDGLMLGICNGFQALIKLGLVPYGEIVDMRPDSPTLTFNTLGRHQSMLVRTRIASNKSPWLQKTQPGDIHTIAISHGEGRFVASGVALEQIRQNGQIATQYVDLDGAPTMDLRFNPNGSVLAIEGITSPDGRVLGKMGHSERAGLDLYKNVPGDHFQPIFEGGVAYFR